MGNQREGMKEASGQMRGTVCCLGCARERQRDGLGEGREARGEEKRKIYYPRCAPSLCPRSEIYEARRKPHSKLYWRPVLPTHISEHEINKGLSACT